MAFDFKKEYKEFYLPKNTPQLVAVPPMNYIAVRGQGIRMRKAARIKRRSGFCMPLPTPLR